MSHVHHEFNLKTYFNFLLRFLHFTANAITAMNALRRMTIPTTPADTDEAMTTTLLDVGRGGRGGRGEGGGRGGGGGRDGRGGWDVRGGRGGGGGWDVNGGRGVREGRVGRGGRGVGDSEDRVRRVYGGWGVGRGVLRGRGGRGVGIGVL